MIRIYGHLHGYSSFAMVTRGMERACKAKEIHAGTVPVDVTYRDDVDYPGALASIGLNCGAPSGVAFSHMAGMHKQRWLLLAPNSDKIPGELCKAIREMLTGILAPSRWALDVLERALPGFPVVLCPHGVMPEHRLDADKRATALAEFQQGRFDVLHMTSSASDRKGTRALLDAWADARKALPAEARLYLVSMGHVSMHAKAWLEGSASPDVVVVDGGPGAPPAQVAGLYSAAHVLCQPSRAEGFGLCPLEALACGVPVVATFCTGHYDTLATAAGGVVRITNGDLAPSEDQPGAMAPTVGRDAIAEALVFAYRHWVKLHTDAVGLAQAVHDQWSWEAAAGPVLAQLDKEAG